MPYSVEFTPRAARELRKLPAATRQRLARVFDQLTDDPLPRGAQQLVGSENLYRLRVGDYRIIFAVEHERSAVVVANIGHRREVYR